MIVKNKIYSVIFVNDIVLTEGLYLVPYQWESEHILNVFCHSGNIRKAINVFNSKCFIHVQRLPKFWERGKKKLPMEVHLWIVMGKHCKFCTTEIRMFCKLIYQSFMPSAFLLLYFKWLIFLTVSGAWFCWGAFPIAMYNVCSAWSNLS